MSAGAARPRGEVIYILRCPGGGDLDGYEFLDEAHMRRWMAQPWDPASKGYRVEERLAEEVKRCPHCGGALELDSNA